MADARRGGCARVAVTECASVRPLAAARATASEASGAMPDRISARAAATVCSAGATADSALLEARHDFHDRTGPMAAVELRLDQPVPAVAAGAVRSGKRIDHGAAGEAGTRPRLQRRDADRLIGDEVPEHVEALELFVEELAHRLGSHVAPREAGATGRNDDVDGGIVDPAAQLLLDETLVVVHQGARAQGVAGGADALGEQIARGVTRGVARIGDGQYRDGERREGARRIDPAAGSHAPSLPDPPVRGGPRDGRLPEPQTAAPKVSR